jgi:YaiO family outer membrane protein
VDELFARARRLAFDGQRAEAAALCRKALERSPEYHDIRILLGRIHTWEGRYDEGRAEFRRVLARRPDYEDARVALADLELWSDHPKEALAVCDEGLAGGPPSAPLLYRRARALKALGDFAPALAAAKAAQVADPDLHEARQLAENLAELVLRSKVSLGYTYDHFDQTFEPWRMVSLGAAHRFDWGSLIGRINRATRFGETGQQVEVDAYPRWKDGTYFYLNAGASEASIFPHRRYGAEAYHNFPKGIEASLGLRHLRFSSSNVTIYTGSIGKYWGDYLFTFRGNATPSSIGASKSGSLSVRRYFGDSENYLSASVGTGVSPDQSNPDQELLQLRSRKAGLSLQGWIHKRVILSGSVAYEKQELRWDTERAQFTLGLGLEWRF